MYTYRIQCNYNCTKSLYAIKIRFASRIKSGERVVGSNHQLMGFRMCHI